MKFPKRIRYRGKELATIYGKSASYPMYRLAWSVQGKRRMKAFDRYGGPDGALAYAEKLVSDLAKGSTVTALSPTQATDALAALERLDTLFRATGKRFSLLAAVGEFAEVIGKLGDYTSSDAVKGFLGNVASIKRKDVAEAVEDFLAAAEPRTKAKDGQRAQLSPEYARIRGILLRRFSGTFPNTAICDLTKQHLDTFVATMGEFSAKYRNHHRAAIRQFLAWSVRQDYLPATHRLNETDGLQPEHANTAAVDFYTAKELRALLEASEGPIRAMIALGALGGLRTSELLRLDWSDVWRVPGHIEVTAGKAKTRQRRLVEIVPALQAWLEPFRSCTTGKVWPTYDNAFQIQFPEVCKAAGVKRKTNGLRHAFCSFHFAAHANENLTAQQAGNSPAMIHANYKGLCTKVEGEKWFAVAPARHENVIAMSGSTAAAGAQAQH